MQWLTLATLAIMIVSGCASSTPTSVDTKSPTQVVKEATVSAPDVPATIEGIRLTIDGQTLDIPGEIQVSRQKGAKGDILYIGKNPSPSAITPANGTLLELSTISSKDRSQEELSTADIAIVTFTVWKGVDFSYVSTMALPGQPVKGLTVSQRSGKLFGSFEGALNGTLGKLNARIEFNVPAPK